MVIEENESSAWVREGSSTRIITQRPTFSPSRTAIKPTEQANGDLITTTDKRNHMCLLVPGRIISIDGENATVDYGSEKRIGRLIEPGYAVGDYALIQGGFVIAKVDSQEAEDSLRAYTQALKSQ